VAAVVAVVAVVPPQPRHLPQLWRRHTLLSS
jgi:hypothetical protein